MHLVIVDNLNYTPKKNSLYDKGPIYTLKALKYYCYSGDVRIMSFIGQKRSNVGQNRKIRVKPGRLVEIYRTYICFDSEFYPEFKFKIF